MEKRKILSLVGIAVLSIAFGLFSYFQIIKLVDLSPILTSVIISSIVGLVVWGFKPKVKKFDKTEYERELRERKEVDNKLDQEERIRDFKMAGGWNDEHQDNKRS